MSRQTSVNPATGEVIADYPEHTPGQVRARIEAAQHAYLGWRVTSFDERAQALRRIAAALTQNKQSYARLISDEMGKIVREGVAEVEKCAACALFFAENGPRFLADEEIPSEYARSFVAYRPLGIVLGIMPWNFPFWQVFRYALPTLMAGNAGLLKHAANTPGCAQAIEGVFGKADLPPHVFQSLLLPSARIEEAIGHPLVRAVTLTGSTPAGRSVASLAGKYLKKTVLELGGSDAYLILQDADLEHAVKTLVASRSLNCGQSCISAKRLIVVEALRERFEQAMAQAYGGLAVGDPGDEGTAMGPMARADLRDALHGQVTRSVHAGARLLAGGVVPSGKGAFYPATVLAGVCRGMPAYDEELFGPVAVIISAKDEEDALRIAGDSEFGLGGGIFTRDTERGLKLARDDMDSGSCFVNMMVRSDPRFPFGGIKDSGYGRELSHFGIREFVNIKTVVAAKS